jgi:hypothetical protein
MFRRYPQLFDRHRVAPQVPGPGRSAAPASRTSQPVRSDSLPRFGQDEPFTHRLPPQRIRCGGRGCSGP